MLRGRPPAHAQAISTAYNREFSTDLAVATQKVDIDRLRSDLDHMADERKEDRNAISTLNQQVAGMQGEARGIGALLLLVQVLAFVFQTRKEKAR